MRNISATEQIQANLRLANAKGMKDLIFHSQKADELAQEIAQIITARLQAAKLTLEKPSDQEVFLDIEGACAFLKLAKATIYSKCSRGELPYIKKFGRLLFSKKELIKVLESGRRNASDHEIEGQLSKLMAK